jgi:hypothetical protein
MTLATVEALERGAQADGRAAPTTTPHPFAEFRRTIGRGATLRRPLDETEAEQAMGMILDGAVEPIQPGAFLLGLRYRTAPPAGLKPSGPPHRLQGGFHPTDLPLPGETAQRVGQAHEARWRWQERPRRRFGAA